MKLQSIHLAMSIIILGSTQATYIREVSDPNGPSIDESGLQSSKHLHLFSMNQSSMYMVKDVRTNEFKMYVTEDQLPIERQSLKIWEKIKIIVDVDITVRSFGSYDVGFNSHPIQINGINSGTKGRGFNVVVLSPTSGTILGARSFDTWGDVRASGDMVSFIESFPDGSIVLIAAYDSAENNFTQQAKDYFASLGSVGAASLGWRTSLAILTAKGVPKPDWFAEKYAAAGAGPSIVKATFHFTTV